MRGLKSTQFVISAVSRAWRPWMGVDLIGLRALAFGKRLGLLNLDQTVTLGRQEIHFSQSEYDDLAKIALMPRAEFSSDDFAEPLLKSLGAGRVESIDASNYEGASIIADLNNPVGDEQYLKYTSLIDFGSLEHIFDVRQVILNVNKLLQENGTVLLLTNANGFVGHGFYQFSPEFFYSVLSDQNGFTQTAVILIDYDKPRNWHYIYSPLALRCRNQAPHNKQYYILCIAKKSGDVDNIHAQQSDYEKASWAQSEHRHFRPSGRGRIKSLGLRLNPTLYEELRALYRSSRLTERRAFAHQTVTFNPECISRAHFDAICSVGTRTLSW
jgi:hypothetical protein